ncbi:MAG TPA: glycerol-3-phosphate dehydrogenase [bacterium]|nr:glycerol-3-phosphate dehydrogenase [bacterium]
MPERDPIDLLIIGGGINGVGVARDAVGRGLSVLLCEQADLASGTSSASSKLIHGGLRYLEQYEFRLVREALAEREVLLGVAPHIIWPLRFVLPHDRTLRPAWMIRVGMFLYDHLTWRHRLPGSRGLRLPGTPEGAPLAARVRRGFAYSDCWVDDSRLVVLNALGAAERGATILTRTRFAGARREGGYWVATLEDTVAGGTRTVRARALVNAAGPWIGQVMQQGFAQRDYRHLALVKGSHIVVPRLHAGDHAYILQHTDGRVVFIIPFLERFSLIGTTDVPFHGDPAQAECTPGEVAYLCEAVNRYLARPVDTRDVVWSYAGVRPLYNDDESDPSAISREYVLELEGGPDVAPLLSLIGGKITAYRQVAERALDKLRPWFPAAGPAWTDRTPLPGGDLPGGDFDGFLAALRARRPWLPADLARRLARAYGSRVERALGDATSLEGLGRPFGGGLYECEVRYLVSHEWARSAEDVLWRRSKLGLFLTPHEAQVLARWMEEQGLTSAPPAAAGPAAARHAGD